MSFKFKKQQASIALPLSAFLLLLLLICFAALSERIHHAGKREQTEILEASVTRSITSCYALEGAYPPNIQYLVDNYGLIYDTDDYFIDYRYIGANLRPDVTIFFKDGGNIW